MGKKITIDSSTLMNKILELIEAQKLFDLPNEKLDIIIHPNSLVHAIVKKKNGLITGKKKGLKTKKILIYGFVF